MFFKSRAGKGMYSATANKWHDGRIYEYYPRYNGIFLLIIEKYSKNNPAIVVEGNPEIG